MIKTTPNMMNFDGVKSRNFGRSDGQGGHPCFLDDEKHKICKTTAYEPCIHVPYKYIFLHFSFSSTAQTHGRKMVDIFGQRVDVHKISSDIFSAKTACFRILSTGYAIPAHLLCVRPSPVG